MTRSYSSADVVEILKRVRDSGADLTTFSESELRDIAREAGLDPDEIGPAAMALRRDKAIEQGVEEILSRRRAGWWNALFTYVVVNSGLALVDWLSGPGWWVYWVLLGWGIGIVLGAKRAFVPDRNQLVRRVGKKYDKARIREQREAAKREQLRAPRAFVDAIDEVAARLVHAASDKVEEAIRSGARVRVESSEADREVHDVQGRSKKRRT